MQQTNKIAELGCTNQEVSQANACLVSSLGLSPDFIGIIGYAPRLTGGNTFVAPNQAHLPSERGRNETRVLYVLPPGQPDYDRQERVQGGNEWVRTLGLRGAADP